jgi:hypothetical protein
MLLYDYFGIERWNIDDGKFVFEFKIKTLSNYMQKIDDDYLLSYNADQDCFRLLNVHVYDTEKYAITIPIPPGLRRTRQSSLMLGYKVLIIEGENTKLLTWG